METILINQEKVVDMLNELAGVKNYLEKLQEEKQRLVEEIMTDEIKQKIADINSEFDEKSAAGHSNAEYLEKEIKNAVALFGNSVQANGLHAVYSKPRVTWDSGKLDGLMIAIPELEKARKVGKPSVSIREI